MSTRTIEPIHVVLPDADGGYYRFDELPRLIADALYQEHPDDDEEAQELQWMKHAIDGVENYKKDLKRAAGLTDGESGYLHVVENTASKRPLEWRVGAVLNAGLVHLDWLNEWGESRRPPLVFSMVSAPELQAAPVVAESAGATTESKEQRQDRRLQACIDAGLPMNTKAALSRLPDGVGDVADREGVTRQAFSTDVKAALKRRESAIREGSTVRRA